MKLIKNTLKVVALAAAIALPFSAQAQTYVRSSTGQSLSNFVLNANSSTNFNLSPFQVGYGGNGKVRLQVEMKAADAGTSNVIFTAKTSIDPDTLGFLDETLSVTNALNGTNTVRFAWDIDVGQARYVKLVSAETTQTNAVTISAKFGQHRP